MKNHFCQIEFNLTTTCPDDKTCGDQTNDFAQFLTAESGQYYLAPVIPTHFS